MTTGSTTDPTTFSIELANLYITNTYIIADDVVTADGQITITLPEVSPGDGYILLAVAIDFDETNIFYAETTDFSIGVGTNPLITGASTTDFTVASGTSTMSVAVIDSIDASATVTTPVSSTSAATTKGTSSAASSTPSTSTSAATTIRTSSAASSTPSTSKSSGAASLKLAGIVPAAALVLSVVAGAAVVF
ncbi:hypothetical protein OG21DRAFT_1513216 [Imleria badia]|nr:hypothetical protein OG21DRAFT_1513216 [Imleria badia]